MPVNSIDMNRFSIPIQKWRALWNPEMYHGWGKKNSFFEGWYFKMIAPSQEQAIAVIPGISMDKQGKKHAFIQVFDGTRKQAFYHTFDEKDFFPSSETFSLHLGKNFFSPANIILDLPEIQGELWFHNQHAWPKMLGAPGIMGWYGFVPFMECYHGVVSLHHTISGNLHFRGKSLPMDNGIGYLEKDWGTSFPSAWIWMQSNHFPHNGPVCLMVSVAKIPWLTTSFTGFIAGFLFEGHLYRFATYTGATIKAELKENIVHIVLQDKRHRLEITGHPAEGADLCSPMNGEMRGKVNESLQSRLDIRFFSRGKCRFEGSGQHAGLEIAGNVEAMTERN
jgi:hypothetical protein